MVEREFTLVSVDPALDAFAGQAADMHAGALVSSREARRALGALVTT